MPHTKIPPVPSQHPGDDWQRLDWSVGQAIATCLAERCQTAATLSITRPLDGDEIASLRTLVEFARDPAGLERLAYLQGALGLAIGWDVDVVDGLRLATRAVLTEHVATGATTPTELNRQRRVLHRHRDRDPGFVSALLGCVEGRPRPP